MQKATAVAALLPTGQFVPRSEIVATELTNDLRFGPQPLACQVYASCGDLAAVAEPLTPDRLDHDRAAEHVETGREVRPELEAHPKETELEAHLEELKAEGRSDIRGESHVEQQEEVHGEDLNETKAMRAEDFQSWWVRECCRFEKPPATAAAPAVAPIAEPATPADAGLGRVLLEARLSWIDDAGIQVILEQRVLQLHLYQREVDAARCFLEEHNGLAPKFVRRYQQPLSRWLQSKVQAAPSEIALKKHVVDGDLEEIARCHGSEI